MDDTLEVHARFTGSDARGSRDHVAHPVDTSIAQRTAPDLVFWSDKPGGLLEPAQERKARRKSVPIGSNPAEKATHELTHTRFRNCCSYCVRAGAADDPHHRQPHKEPEFPIIMSDLLYAADAPGSELFTMHVTIKKKKRKKILYVVTAVGTFGSLATANRHLLIDGESAIRALGVRFNTLGAKRQSSSVEELSLTINGSRT